MTGHEPTIEGGAVPLPEDRERAFDDWWSRVFFTGGGAEASAREAFRAGWDAGQPHRAAVPPGDDEDYSLTYEQAVAMLPDGEQVHAILDGDIALIGADWDRADVLALLRDGRPEVSGQQAAASGHGMVAFPPLGPVFIATRPAEGPAA